CVLWALILCSKTARIRALLLCAFPGFFIHSLRPVGADPVLKNGQDEDSRCVCSCDTCAFPLFGNSQKEDLMYLYVLLITLGREDCNGRCAAESVPLNLCVFCASVV